MKTYRFIATAFLLLTAVLMFSGAKPAPKPEETVVVSGDYLTDDTGYNYGVNYFLDSYVNGQTYVYPYVISKNNVIGSIVSGPVLMQPNEKHVGIGSFIINDRSKGWSTNVGAKWKSAD